MTVNIMLCTFQAWFMRKKTQDKQQQQAPRRLTGNKCAHQLPAASASKLTKRTTTGSSSRVGGGRVDSIVLTRRRLECSRQ